MKSTSYFKNYNLYLANILKTILSNDIVENNIETKKLFSWLTSNNHILLLMDIGNELNRYLYGEESCKINYT